MNWSYLFKHWVATLTVAPAIMILLGIVTKQLNEPVDQSLILYLLFWVYALVFSLPTLLGYAIVLFLSKPLKSTVRKMILISWTVFGIVVTLTIVGGSFSKTIMISYVLTAIATGIAFRLPSLKPVVE